MSEAPRTGQDVVLNNFFVRANLDTIVKARGGSGFEAATAADSATLRTNAQTLYARTVSAPTFTHSAPI